MFKNLHFNCNRILFIALTCGAVLVPRPCRPFGDLYRLGAFPLSETESGSRELIRECN